MNYRFIILCAIALNLSTFTPAKAEIISFANPFSGLFSRFSNSQTVEAPATKSELRSIAPAAAQNQTEESSSESSISSLKVESTSVSNRSTLEKMIEDKENHAAQILYRLQDRNDDYSNAVEDLNNLTIEQEAAGKELPALRAALDRASEKIQEANELIAEATEATQEYSGIAAPAVVATESTAVSLKTSSLSKANSKKVQLNRLKGTLKAAEAAVQEARKAVYDLKKFKGDLQKN